MKKINLLLTLLVFCMFLTSCSTYASEDGIAVYSKNGSIRITGDAWLLIIIIGLTVLVLIIVGIVVSKKKSHDIEAKRDKLDNDFERGKISRSTYIYEMNKLDEQERKLRNRK